MCVCVGRGGGESVGVGCVCVGGEGGWVGVILMYYSSHVQRRTVDCGDLWKLWGSNRWSSGFLKQFCTLPLLPHPPHAAAVFRASGGGRGQTGPRRSLPSAHPTGAE